MINADYPGAPAFVEYTKKNTEKNRAWNQVTDSMPIRESSLAKW